jgi:pimeloyl-ACP methyl ester carboxylesterase
MRLLWLLLLIPALLTAGMIYQWTGAWKDRKKFRGLGTLVDVGKGRRMYLSQKGVGWPAVIFESGIAATSQNWAVLQESVSNFAYTVSYDRSGLGWSSSCASEPTPSNIVRELRLLLQQAYVPPPYVLVGHSFGGLVAQYFAAEHADEVVGVVLVDAMRTDDWPPVNETQRALLERGVQLAGMAVPIARFGLARLAITSLLCRSGRMSRMFSRAAGSGGLHVLDRITCEVGKMPREVWPIVAAHWSSPKFYHGLAAHVRAVPASVCEMHDAKPIEGIPVVALTAGTAEPLSSSALRRIGPTARQVIAEKSGHWIHLDEPDLVLEAIRNMVEQVRSNLSGSVEFAVVGDEVSDCV